MWLLYQITHNYAFAILLFTLVTKLLMFPLTVKQQKSSAIMSAFTPKLNELKKKYANNPQKMQEEQMKLYQEEGANPLASCLPMLVTLPLLIGIFDVVYRPITHIIRASSEVITKATEITSTLIGTVINVKEATFNSRPEIYIVQAIQKDPALFSNAGIPADFIEKVSEFNNRLFGFIDLGNVPNFKPEVWTAAAVGLIAIPIMSGVVNLISSVYSYIRQKKLAAAGGGTSSDGPAKSMMTSMNAMLFIMPVFSVVIAIGYPAAIGFYWTCGALIGLLQSIIINRIYTPEYVAALVEKDKLKNKDKNTKRRAAYERYQQMMAEKNGSTYTPQSRITVSSSVKSDDENESEEVKLSKSQQREIERKLINEARRRQAEKYGDEYTEE
jgi:YidC/Oxa1 family membrane protein insertase